MERLLRESCGALSARAGRSLIRETCGACWKHGSLIRESLGESPGCRSGFRSCQSALIRIEDTAEQVAPRNHQ
jgi:hypothetical protein